MHLSKIFASYLQKRNEKIIKLRKQGEPIKNIAYKFKLTERHIRRIIRNNS